MPTAAVRRARPSLIQVLLVTLPVGTVVLGIFAMWLYFQRDNSLNPLARPGFYPQEPSIESLTDRVAKLSGPVIGARGPADENTRHGLRAVRAFVEGSLGPGNMGYSVNTQDFQAGETSFANLWVDVIGGRNPTEIIEVRVAQDVPPGTFADPAANVALAATLELAHAFVGTESRRTIRFVFLANEADPLPESRPGSAYFNTLMDDRRIKVLTVFNNNEGDFDAARLARPDGTIDFEAALSRIEVLRSEVSRHANR